MFLTDEIIAKRGVAAGDELFFPGLFKRHIGQNQNIPIVRTGAIAAMPSELIETANCGSQRGYLGEARSIAAMSGSPVFLYLDRGARLPGRLILGQMPNIFFLGLVHGHYDEKEFGPGAFNMTEERINLGIAIANAATDVAAALDSPTFIAQRKAFADKVRKERATLLTSED